MGVRGVLRPLARLLSLLLMVSFGFGAIAKEILVSQVSLSSPRPLASRLQYMRHFYAARLAPLIESRLFLLGLGGIRVEPEALRHAMSCLEWTIAVLPPPLVP